MVCYDGCGDRSPCTEIGERDVCFFDIEVEHKNIEILLRMTNFSHLEEGVSCNNVLLGREMSC